MPGIYGYMGHGYGSPIESHRFVTPFDGATSISDWWAEKKISTLWIKKGRGKNYRIVDGYTGNPLRGKAEYFIITWGSDKTHSGYLLGRAAIQTDITLMAPTPSHILFTPFSQVPIGRRKNRIVIRQA